MLLEEGVCYDQCILLAKLLAFDLLHFVLQAQICLLLQVTDILTSLKIFRENILSSLKFQFLHL